MNFGEMKRKCESKGLGFTRFSREAVEGLLERARRALARPLASLVPPPPLCDNNAVTGFNAAIWRRPFSVLGERQPRFLLF